MWVNSSSLKVGYQKLWLIIRRAKKKTDEMAQNRNVSQLGRWVSKLIYHWRPGDQCIGIYISNGLKYSRSFVLCPMRSRHSRRKLLLLLKDTSSLAGVFSSEHWSLFQVCRSRKSRSGSLNVPLMNRYIYRNMSFDRTLNMRTRVRKSVESER